MSNSYDISTIFISLILIAYFAKSKKIRNYQNTIFYVLIIFNMITAIAETVESMLFLDSSIRYVFTEVYFITHIMIIPFLFIYILSMVANWYSIRPMFRYIFLGPSIVGVVLTFINPLVNFIFSYSDAGFYQREKGIILLYVLVLYYILLIVGLIVKYRTILSVVQRGAVIASLALTTGSVIYQLYKPEIKLEAFAVVFSILIMTFCLNNAYEQVEPETNLFSKHSLNAVIEHNISIHKPFYLIEIVFTNFDMLDFLRDDMSKMIIKALTDYIDEICAKVTLFRYDDNAIVVEIEKMDEEYISEIIDLIQKRVKKPFEIAELEILLTLKIINLNIPQEVKNLGAINAILHDALKSDIKKEVMTARDFDIDFIERKNKIDSALAKAIHNQSIELSYTPMYSFTQNKIIGAKILPRFLDEEIGYITEDEIIRYSEKTGNLNIMSDRAFDLIADFLALEEVKNSGIEFVSVNLSSVFFLRNELMDKLLKKIKEHKIDNSKIMFMLSEELISKVYKQIDKLMEKYTKKGFRFGICDYGSGMSDIQSLYELPFEMVSISDSVLRDATKLYKASVALEATLDLAKDLGIKTMLNGINNVGEFELVAGMSCDYITGSYLFEAVDGRKMIEIANEKIRIMGGFDISDSE